MFNAGFKIFNHENNVHEYEKHLLSVINIVVARIFLAFNSIDIKKRDFY